MVSNQLCKTSTKHDDRNKNLVWEIQSGLLKTSHINQGYRVDFLVEEMFMVNATMLTILATVKITPIICDRWQQS